MSSYCKVWINGQEIEADADRKLIDVLRNDVCEGRVQRGRLRNLYGAGGRKSHQGLRAEDGAHGGKAHSHRGGVQPA